MYRVPGLLVAVLLTFPSWAQEPEDQTLTTGFNVAGGHYEKWQMDTYFDETNEGPIDLNFVLTAANTDRKWGSTLSFFFGGGEGAEGGPGQAPGDPAQEIRLRFLWDPDRHAFLPVFRSFSPGKEKDLARMDMPIGLNEPVSLSVGKREAEGRTLTINGTQAPVRLDSRLRRFTILVSGVRGTISTSRALASSPSWALEPAGKYHITNAFKVKGGFVETWIMEDYLAQTDDGPIDMRFVLTGRNGDEKWASNFGFFFSAGEGAAGGRDEAPKEAMKEMRLRFVWYTDGIFPLLSDLVGDEEKDRDRLDTRIQMNEPVTLSIRKNGEGGRSLFINGTEAPMRLDPALDRMQVVVSGIEGTITMPSF